MLRTNFRIFLFRLNLKCVFNYSYYYYYYKYATSETSLSMGKLEKEIGYFHNNVICLYLNNYLNETIIITLKDTQAFNKT